MYVIEKRACKIISIKDISTVNLLNQRNNCWWKIIDVL